MLKLRSLCLAALLSVCVSGAHAGYVMVAVASSFSVPMQKIAAQFEQETRHHLALSFGPTGRFYEQITRGAPFGVLIAADQATPEKLAAQGLAEGASRYTYAIGQLALWSRNADLVDAQGEVLKRSDWQHLATANPQLSPYGAAARETLETLGLAQQLQARITEKEDLTQTQMALASGKADLGFVAFSQTLNANGQPIQGSVWKVPAGLHAPLRQDAIVLKKGAMNEAAVALVHFLKSDKARAIIESYGYAVPE